ncbi:MAG: hypothetical protein MHM6MM_003767 [Cercozoa sp. M6MM]
MSASYSLTTFSSSGKLGAIDNAMVCINKAKLSLGVKSKSGVVVVSEKRQNTPLVDITTVQKVYEITPSAGVAFSGMGTDFRVLLKGMRKEAQKYYLQFREHMPLRRLARATADKMQEFTQAGGVRPFGCSVLLCGHDHTGFHLFLIDPAGSCQAWKATAIGKGSSSTRTFLEKRYTEELDLDDTIASALASLREGCEGALDAESVEVGVVDEQGFRILGTEEVSSFF